MSGQAERIGWRRVVTGINEAGRSCVVIDDQMPRSSPSTGLAWSTDTMPVDNSGSEDVATRPFSFEMLHSGTTFMVAEYPPGTGKDPYWHATDTIDYIVVLKGEIVIVLEKGEARVRAGEFIVDRGVVHAWRNDGDETAAAAIVTVPAHPVGKGKTV